MCTAVQLYTGNRDGQVEALDLREMGSFTCEVSDLSVCRCAVILDRWLSVALHPQKP